MTIGSEFPRVLDAARAGEEWAWRILYRELAPALLSYLAMRSDHAEDISSDVFHELVQDLPRFKGDESAFRAWVFLIARHRLIDDYRRRARRRDVPVPREDLGEAVAPDDVEHEALGNVVSPEILEVLSRLPEAQRDVVLLRLVAGLSVEEVAGVMGKRRGAIRALQHRAVQALRRMLEGRNTMGSSDGT